MYQCIGISIFKFYHGSACAKINSEICGSHFSQKEYQLFDTHSIHERTLITRCVEYFESMDMELDMMTSSNGNIFRATCPLCGEYTGERWIPHTKGQWRGALICAWINGWINNREAGDLRRHRAHYNVILMKHSIIYEIFIICGYLISTILSGYKKNVLAVTDNAIECPSGRSRKCTNQNTNSYDMPRQQTLYYHQKRIWLC